MLGRNLPDLRELAEVGKILAWLGFARPLPRHVDSRPPGPAFDAFPTSAKPPGGKSAARPPRRPPVAHPTPDLREASERENPRPTSAKKRRSGKFLPGKSWPDLLAWGPFWVNFWVPKNILLPGNDFVVGIQGNPSCPNEFYGPWDPYGQASLSKQPFKKIKSTQIPENPKNCRWPLPPPRGLPYSPLKVAILFLPTVAHIQ